MFVETITTMKLCIQNISKTYPNGTKALDNLSLDISTGMFGLLGPNGAGKSSLMRTIATLQQPDSGTITFGDLNIIEQPMALRSTLGYLPQEFGVYPRYSADRLLDYMATLKGITSKKDRRLLIDYCLEVTNLTPHRRVAVSSYSGGMKQRFGIAQLLLNNPKLIIVDEPTAGLDPAERQRFLNILREISQESIVIFSTHIVEDIQDLCIDMAIMNHGRILLHDTPEAATASLKEKLYTTNIDKEEIEEYQKRYEVLSGSFNRHHQLRIKVLTDAPGPELRPATPGLEDVYFAALGAVNVGQA